VGKRACDLGFKCSYNQLTLQYESSFDDNVNVQFTSIAPKIVHNYATWSGAL
jgi:hypothetical protein